MTNVLHYLFRLFTYCGSLGAVLGACGVCGERFVLQLNIKKKYSVPVFSIAPVLLCIPLLLQSIQYARMYSAAALEVNIRIAAQCRLQRCIKIRFIWSYKHSCRIESIYAKV